MSTTQAAPQPTETVEVSHEAFRAGLPAGHFRLIVNPEKARKYVKRRLLLTFILLPVLSIGAALALAGYSWAGLALVIFGVVGHRVIHHQAPKLLLHLALSDARVYAEAIHYEIMEVRRAR
ncbi:MAG: hypothetical protein OEY75_04870 [Hylemonella sp.]|nr:hypothetical protein [Hylemonella sp.]MDH5708425.1 hypothetical protein [Hylemonella sp.]